MSTILPDGLYDQLLTEELQQLLDSHTQPPQRTLQALSGTDSHQRLVEALSEQLGKVLQDLAPNSEDKTQRPQTQLALVNALLVDLRARLLRDYPDRDYADNIQPLRNPPELLQGIHRRGDVSTLPDTGLATPWLFTASKSSPALLNELRHELASSDQVDILMSFITVSGLRKIRDVLESITAVGADGVPRTRLRILTTTYTGATEAQALDELARLPGCHVRVSLDGRRTRLHAKAWIFGRNTGFGSAYVGSANLTQAAMIGGLEWTVKFTERGQAALFSHAQAHFETLWQDSEFAPYHPDQDGHRAALDAAIASEKGGYGRSSTSLTVLSFFDLQPKNYQQEMLEQLQHERDHGRFRNLLVAATGTGKTVVAAFDYRQTCQKLGGRPRLLFIAHRVEILQQALRTYREVLRDPSFGQLLGGGVCSDCPDHLFTTIESLHSQQLLARHGADYWHSVVFDECHRLAADTFDAVAMAIQPKILLGLTATPERSDGKPILPYFDARPDGGPAVELRLWHALDLQLLAPFEYFACDDDTNLRNIPWRQSGEQAALDKLLNGNHARARLIINEWRRLCANPRASRAIAFCISIAHAQFMTDQFNHAGLPALCISGQSSKEERDSAPHKLATGEVSVLVTVDLYNEGVDLPLVDTLLLLRPTQSPVLFQQQIGRGLRLAAGKESCLILDFVGQHDTEFRFDNLLGSLTGLNRRQLRDGVEHGFSQLPSGCHLQLQKRTREQVLRNLQALIQQNWRRLIRELQAYVSLNGRQTVSLPRFVHDQALEISDIYRDSGNSGWTSLKRAAGLLSGAAEPEENYFGRRFSDLLHIDDSRQLALMQRIASHTGHYDAADQDEALRLQMLAYQVDGQGSRVGSWQDFLQRLSSSPNCQRELDELAQTLENQSTLSFQPIPDLEDMPLGLHARYRIREILTACGYLTADKRPRFGEGVLRLNDRQTELLFVTLDKSSGYHDRIAYHDYAISRELFHWQTQNSSGPTTKSGQRYLESVGENGNGWQFQLFVRTDQDSAYYACGPVTLEEAQGNQPMNITWRLTVPLPATLFRQFSVLRGT